MVQVQCSHIYVLPPPNGVESIGVCKLCGVTKTHFNSGNEKNGPWRTWDGKDTERKRKGIGTERK